MRLAFARGFIPLMASTHRSQATVWRNVEEIIMSSCRPESGLPTCIQAQLVAESRCGPISLRRFWVSSAMGVLHAR